MQKIIGLVHTRFSSVGGVENYINRLVDGLLARNWRIHYITAKADRAVPPGVTIHKVPIIRGTSVSKMLSFAHNAKRLAKKSNLPLIFGFGRTIYQDIYRDGSGCFLDYEQHMDKHFNWLYRKSYLYLERKRFADSRLRKVVAISGMVHDQILARYPLSRQDIIVIYNGVDTNRFYPGLKEKKEYFRKELEIPRQDFVILFVGNGFKRKGLEYLLAAIALLPTEIPLTLLVAGRDKKAGKYVEMSKELGCRHRIRFLGHQENLASLYGAADLFILPSVFDAYASVVGEALYTGTPVITGPQVGASELIKPGLNGYIVQDYQAKTIADTLLDFYYSSYKDYMSMAAHESAAENRWNLHIDKLEELFFEILELKYGSS